MNEDLNEGAFGAEWAIGYDKDQAKILVGEANLQVNKIVTWRVANSEACWLWVEASR